MKLSLIALAGTVALAQQASAQQFRSVHPDIDVKVLSTAGPSQSLPPAPVAGSDSCATAEVIPAVGTIAYTNAAATTGPEGQATFLGGECNNGCAQYGNPQVAIPEDVWFSFTAPTSGRLRVSTCGSANDVKIGVYLAPCASIAGTCLACNDDYHNAVSGLVDAGVIWTATASTTYLIQVGNSSFTAGGTIAGSFELRYVDYVTSGIWDNGTFYNAIGITNAGDGAMMMQGFKAPPGIVTVTGADVTWFTGAIPANTPVTIAIYDDPNDDQNPSNAVLLASVNGVANGVTNAFTTYNFTSPVPVSGDYFIAVTEIDVGGVDFPWAISGESCEEHPNSSWFGTHTAAAYDIGTVGNPLPLTGGNTLFRLGAQCAYGTTTRHSVWGIRANQVIAPTDTPFTSLCAGDGTDQACPCTNNGTAGHGCQNTVGSGGAILTSTGIASISADTLVLHNASAVPFGPGLFFQGSTTVNPTAPFGVTFGNGLRCLSGATPRVEIRFADGAGDSATTVAIASIFGGVAGSGPGPYHYQVWYRDTGNVGTCMPGAGFNLSNAIRLVWAP